MSGFVLERNKSQTCVIYKGGVLFSYDRPMEVMLR